MTHECVQKSALTCSRFDRDDCKIMKYSVFTNDCNIDRCNLCGNSPSVTLTRSPACFLVVTPFSKKVDLPYQVIHV